MAPGMNRLSPARLSTSPNNSISLMQSRSGRFLLYDGMSSTTEPSNHNNDLITFHNDGSANAQTSRDESNRTRYPRQQQQHDDYHHQHHHHRQQRQDVNSGSGRQPSSGVTFPEVLKMILSDPSNSDAITWLPHGKSFLVVNRKRFVDEILPQYLGKATKYTSFTRKLSRWNFARIASGPDEGAWFNKNFFRDDAAEKVRSMKCAKRYHNHQTKQKRPTETAAAAATTTTTATTGISTLHYPRSVPLKKRPVDISLFPGLARRPNHLPVRFPKDPSSPPPPSSSSPGRNGYHYHHHPRPHPLSHTGTAAGGRPLGLADTRSVVTAAMQALLQSQSNFAMPPQHQQHPSPAPSNNTPMSVLTALQQSQQLLMARQSSPTSTTPT